MQSIVFIHQTLTGHLIQLSMADIYLQPNQEGCKEDIMDLHSVKAVKVIHFSLAVERLGSHQLTESQKI